MHSVRVPRVISRSLAPARRTRSSEERSSCRVARHCPLLLRRSHGRLGHPVFVLEVFVRLPSAHCAPLEGDRVRVQGGRSERWGGRRAVCWRVPRPEPVDRGADFVHRRAGAGTVGGDL
eukprot:ctg_2838.g561